jgi:hypothetical protein
MTNMNMIQNHAVESTVLIIELLHTIKMTIQRVFNPTILLRRVHRKRALGIVSPLDRAIDF